MTDARNAETGNDAMTRRSLILVVDDEPFNVDYLEQELELLGYDTESAASGREALEKVAANAPDLILLDVMMPGIDGFTVCRMLKDDRKTRRIPVVIMTALNSTEDRIKGIEAGADDFLTKPVDDRELLARIQTALRVKHAVDDEIGDLKKVTDHLAKFVPDSVKRIIDANPDDPDLEKRDQDVSVMFVDISGYSRLSEKMPVEVLNMMVERYFSRFFDCIQEKGGEISETSGDGLMVIFPDSELGRHADRAVKAAHALIEACEKLNRENTVQPLSVHIGVNSGRALVGSTRFEGRMGSRWVFTADGPVTNLASRIADFAKEGEILVGPRTAALLEGSYVFEKMGQKRFKNLAEPVDLLKLREVDAGPRRSSSFDDDEPASTEQSRSRRLGAVVAMATSDPEEDAIGATGSAVRDRFASEAGAHRGQFLFESDGALFALFGGPNDALEFAVGMADHGGFGIGVDMGHVTSAKGGPEGRAIDRARDLAAIAAPGDALVSERFAGVAGAGGAGVILESAGARKIGASDERIEVFHAHRGQPDATDVSAAALNKTNVVVQPPTREVERSAADGDAAVSWPDEYRGIADHLRQTWAIEGDVHLLRQLSGKSGAFVFAVDLMCRDYSGQAILKLDRSQTEKWSEAEEADRHQQAAAANLDFAREHLPVVVHTTRHDGQVGVLTTIAGEGLEYVVPFFEGSYRDQMSAVRSFPRGILADWNRGGVISEGTLWPQDLLSDWLGYRLDPTQGRLFDFVTGVCDLAPDEPSFIVDGHWYPNPLAFAFARERMPERVQVRALDGQIHGDLHGMNILLRPTAAGGTAYYLIDLALYEPDAHLFYDHGYFELSYLLHHREQAPISQWRALLEAVEDRNRRTERGAETADDLGLVQLCNEHRDCALEWMQKHEPHRLPALESQYMLARVAAGLNYANKPMTRAARVKALLFAAKELKGYVKFQNIDWPKEGRTLAVEEIEASE